MRKFNKRLTALALVLSMSLGGVTSVYGVTSEQLNNKVAENSTLVEKVDGVNLTGSFRVNMSDTSDKIDVYKLAKMEWDGDNKTFKKPEWVQEVKNWLTTGAGKDSFGAYDTPEKLAAATSSIQTDFYKAVLGQVQGVAGATITTSYSSGTDTTVVVKTPGKDRIYVNDSTRSELGLTKVSGYREIGTNNLLLSGESFEGTTLEGDNFDAKKIEKIDVYYNTTDNAERYTEGDIYSEAENGYFTVKDVEVGIYGILGSSTSKTYSPVTVSLIPNRDGAAGNWYLSQEIETDLKAANIKMEKTINGKKSDIVEVGETVDFEITYTLPKYDERTINNTTAQYTLTFDDELSDSFSLDQNSVIVKYRTSDGTDWKDAPEFDKSMYSSFISSPRTDTDGDGSLEDEYGLLLYGCSVSHLYLYTIYENRYKYYISTADSAMAGYTASDSAHSKPFVTGATWDAEREAYFLDYYAFYYYRDGAYHLIKNDDPDKQWAPYYNSTGTKLTVPVTPGTTKLNSNQIRAVYSSETYDTIGHGWQFFPYGGSTKASTDSYYHNVFNITFDYAKIIDTKYKAVTKEEAVAEKGKDSSITVYKYDSSTGRYVSADTSENTQLYFVDKEGIYNKNVEVQITYKAQVNRDCKTGVETNTNVAKMKYEANGAGTVFTVIEDKVNAYTYGVNVVKIDGDTAATTPKYLSGATFKLYKETDTFVGGTYAGSMADSKTTGLTSESTLAAYKENHKGDNYYYYEYDAAEGGETLDALASADAKVQAAENEKVTRVFELVTLKDSRGTWFDGTITSTNTANGAVISGISTGNYVLVETQAPEGYNKLAEDMLFSVYPMDKDKAETEFAGSYAVFADDATGETVNDDNGIYEMSVLNYKGLTLPSTGGMGTLLFTIIGIIIMMLAVILVIAKSRKNSKNLATFMALAVLVGLGVFANTQNVYAITEVTLNNQYGTLVTGENNVDFTIDLKNEGDTVEVYQIGELKWDSTNNTYDGPYWVLGVEDAVRASTDYKECKTPEDLGAADTAKQIEFLDWIYENKETNNLGQTNKVGDAKIVLSADKLHYSVKGVPYGIYMIKAQNSTTKKDYQLLTVNAMPTQQGPVGAWYLKDNIIANLKFSNVVALKTIDGKTGEAVKTGQTVVFEITGEVPDYPGVKKEDGSLDFSKYPFAVTDTMSAAFEYDTAEGVKVEYTKDNDARDDETVWVEVPADKFTSIFKKAATSTASEGLMLFKDNNGNKFLYCDVTNSGSTYTMNWYSYDPERGVLTHLGQTTGSSVPSTLNDATIRNKYVEALGIQASTFTRLNVNEFTGLQNVTFDYDYLHSEGIEAKNVRITYQATVTSKAVVGADTNTNEATFFYQKNLVGDPGTTSSIVNAWTYALNVIKSDGDKANSYLANAKFKLYKEAYTFVPNADSLGTTKADYGKYVFLKSHNDYEGTATDYANLKAIDDEQGGDYYYRIVEMTGACDDTTCQATSDHSHMIAYALYTFKDSADQDATVITSVATADGVTISGLAPASYVLIETEAPAGYNRLEEALRFEITELTTDQAKTLYSTESLKGFISDEEYTSDEIAADTGKTLKYVEIGDKYFKAYVDGVYPINVKNYAGLTLPSTGGMGTLLFTIVGITVMGFVMVIIIVKKKKEEY